MPATYEVIQSYNITSSTASVTFSSIPQTYTDLVLSAHGTTVASGTYGFRFRANGDTSNTCSFATLFSNQDNGTGVVFSANSNFSFGNMALWGDTRSNVICNFFDYSNPSKKKSYLSQGGIVSTTLAQNRVYLGIWNDASTITSLEIFADSTNLAAGTKITLFGIKGE